MKSVLFPEGEKARVNSRRYNKLHFPDSDSESELVDPKRRQKRKLLVKEKQRQERTLKNYLKI